MTNTDLEGEAAAASITEVERETGLSKDTLRIWERRYGFPKPHRDMNDERCYPPAQVRKLRVIRQLMDAGIRPGKIVGLSLRELSERSRCLTALPTAVSAVDSELQQVLALIKSHRADELHQRLVQMLMQLGLRRFIPEVVVPINRILGEGWLEGTVEIFEEHLYAEQVQRLLHHAIGSLPQFGQPPRVLLTTLPGEDHQLGTLMAHAFFAMEGAHCISLGPRTPAAQIVKAVQAHAVDIVGLSVTAACRPRSVWAQVADLRTRLDDRVQLWTGGTILRTSALHIPGVMGMPSVTDIVPAVARWRADWSG